MRMHLTALVALLLLAPAAAAKIVRVAEDESVQAAVDAAEPGDVIELAAGAFDERVRIAKPLTLRGAGWQQTRIAPALHGTPSDAEKIAFADRLLAAASDDERAEAMRQFLVRSGLPTIEVIGVEGVRIERLSVGGPVPASVDGLAYVPLVRLAACEATIADCAIVGPFWNGVNVVGGARATIERTLIAGLWNVGLYAGGNDGLGGVEAKPPSLVLRDSDVRNCYGRGVALRADDVRLERNRISGSAWHGVRYDDCSPTLRGNRIWGNARTGLYASGDTRAVVEHNVFGHGGTVSLWFRNNDTITRNTFSGVNLAMSVMGASVPIVRENLFAGCEVGVWRGRIEGHADLGVGRPALSGNAFWLTAVPVKVDDVAVEPPPGNSVGLDPELGQFGALPSHAPAGATATVAAPTSPFDVQPGERAIIPDGDTRDWQAWKKPGE